MARYCFTKKLADKLQQAAKEGKINVAQLYEMTSTQRSNFFAELTNKEVGSQVNAAFEEAMISDQKNALKNWAKRTFGTKEVKKRSASVIEKIDRLDQLGLLTNKNSDNFLYDLVSTQLGLTVTPDEAAKIAQLAKIIQNESTKLSEFGTPTLEYFKAKKAMDDYTMSLTPSSKLKVLTGTIGRGSMLFSIKSPLLNIESNTIQAFLQGAERRLTNLQLSGKNGTYANQYMKFINKVYDQTGYDLTRMRTLDTDKLVRGEEMITAQGEGKIRKVGRFYEDLVFKKLMGKPDVVFAAFHFTDSANLASTKIAKQEGLKGDALQKRSLEIFKDATRIDPITEQGKKVREQAIADAELATYTNKGTFSELSLGIRKLFNLISGDLRLGDQLMPFVKTPANVIQAGVDASGVTLPFETLWRATKTIQAIKNGENVTTAMLESFDGYSRKLVRAGLGMTLAAILSSAFEPEDFIGEYPVSQKERELLKAGNATTNSVRIGNKWYSLDYFGALGTPFVAMMYAKKYGNNSWSALYNYYLGAGRQIAKLPGLEIGKDTFELLSKTDFGKQEDVKTALQKGVVDYLKSRTVPAFVYDVAKATDEFERRVEKDAPLGTVRVGIPGLRQQLNPKINVFGETIKSEGFISTMLFGSRIKTANTTPIVQEMQRLATTGNLPPLTDYAQTSDRMKNLKTQIGKDKFYEAEKYLGNKIKDKFGKEINSASYKRASDEDKVDRLQKLKEEALEETLRKFKYKEPKKKK